MTESRTLTADEVVAIRRMGRQVRILLAILSPLGVLTVGGAIVMGVSELRDGAWLFGTGVLVMAIGISWLYVAMWRTARTHGDVTTQTTVFRHSGVFNQTGGRIIHYRIGTVPIVFLLRALRRSLRIGEHCDVELVCVSGPALVIAVHDR